MSRMNYETLKLAWLDTETTGLETEGGGLFEVACVITDTLLNELGQFEVIVNPGTDAINNMNDYVRAMHTKNGLLERVKRTNQTMEEGDKKMSKFLKSYNSGEPRNIIMAGNSVAGVDIPFLREFFPLSMKEIHYRYLDITSLSIAVGVHFGDDTNFQKKLNHRALDDVRECIDEYKHISSRVFANTIRTTF